MPQAPRSRKRPRAGCLYNEAGLQPAGDAGTYRQSFSVPTAIRLGTPNRLTLVADPARVLTLGTDFAPLAVSDSGAITAEVVFAGYGITAPDRRYDDYGGSTSAARSCWR